MYVEFLANPTCCYLTVVYDFDLCRFQNSYLDTYTWCCSSVAMATPLWTAHCECPEHVRLELDILVRSLPPLFLSSPVYGEVFDNRDTCHERFQGWPLSQGFAIVRKSGSLKQARPRFEFRCIHHGNDTLSTRKLEEHVERDEEDHITTQRKQEATSINVRNCFYLICLRINKSIGMVLANMA